MNRIDTTVVFHPLRPEQLDQILEIELEMVQQRVLETAKGRFLFRVTSAARNFLLQEGTDLKYGARHLKRAIERHVVYPLASLLATGQVVIGDVLCIDWDEEQGRLVFMKKEERALAAVEALLPPTTSQVSAASVDGRPEQISASNVVTEPPASNFPIPAPLRHTKMI